MLAPASISVWFSRLCTLLGLSIMLGACTESRTGFDVSVVVDAELKVEQLIYSIEVEGERTDPLLSAETQAVLIFVSEGWGGKQARIHVKGISQGKVVISGSALAEVRAGQLRTVVVFMGEEGCEASCEEGETQCAGDGVRRCEAMVDGCVRWSPTIPCPTDAPHCSAGICAATCSDECEEGERRCSADRKLQVCGQHDGDACSEWGSPLSCGENEACVAGQCIPQCEGGPCLCSAEETQRCDDVGQCRNGVRRCVDGQFGACQWERGPSPESCDGQDNDCNGVEDDGLFAPACAKQAGVCVGSRQRCDGEHGWRPCDSGDYLAAAASLGLSYEGEETRCDGQDNDCDGRADEPASCQPDPCGDGVCGAGETPASCPQDCKADPCGDGVCGDGETTTSCPQDCDVDPCGDGICAYLETPTSCPRDCSLSCSENAETTCVDGHTLSFCLDGVWKKSSCEDVCAIEIGAEPEKCAYSEDADRDLCFCQDPPVGKVCTGHADCENNTVCTAAGGGAKGYCTEPCTVGGNECMGPWPASILPSIGICTDFGGKLGCEFTCNLFMACPAPLQCTDMAGGLCYAP